MTDNQVAIGMLEHAIVLDPDFAPAYAELADAYRVRFTQFAPQEKEWEGKAFRAADKAISLDPDLAEAYVARGFLLWTPSQGFRHKEAMQEYRHALTLNPNLDEAHHYLGNVYIHIGLPDRGIEELQRAVALNPSNTPARARIGVALLYHGRCEQVSQSSRVIYRRPIKRCEVIKPDGACFVWAGQMRRSPRLMST
jgi:tetratricopeptide (TPR) repeat protein